MMKFHNYIVSSHTDDLVSLMRNTLYKAEFTSKRIPRAWKIANAGNEWTPSWNWALKFIYQQATKRDLTFDYLQVLSLGLDRDTRIPLSVDALLSL